jgi:hypothetical protein
LPSSRPVTITAGQLSRETITLQNIEGTPGAIAPQVASPPLPVARLPSSQSPVLPAVAADPRAPEDTDGGWQRSAAWISGVGAVLFAGGALVGQIARGHYADRVDGAIRDGRCTQNGNQFTGDGNRDCANAATDRDQAAVVALVSGGLAGTFALASAIFFLAAPPAADARIGPVSPRTRFAFAPAGGGALLQCGGSF